MYGSLSVGFGLLASIFTLIDLCLSIHEGEIMEKIIINERFERIECHLFKNDNKIVEKLNNKSSDDSS